MSFLAKAVARSSGESAKTLTLFQNDVARQLVPEFPGHKHKKDGSYVYGIYLSISRLDAWLPAVLRCLMDGKKPERHREK